MGIIDTLKEGHEKLQQFNKERRKENYESDLEVAETLGTGDGSGEFAGVDAGSPIKTFIGDDIDQSDQALESAEEQTGTDLPDTDGLMLRVKAAIALVATVAVLYLIRPVLELGANATE